MKLELHIPCRDPIEHLMSLCNHKKRTFTCYDYNDDNDDNDDNDEDNDSNVSNNNTPKTTTTKKNKNLQLLEKEIHNCIVGKSLCGKYGCGIQTKEEIDTIRNNQMNIHQEYSRKYKKTLKYKKMVLLRLLVLVKMKMMMKMMMMNVKMMKMMMNEKDNRSNVDDDY